VFLIPTGGLLIDTPGMREFQLWDAGDGLEEAFDEIKEWSAQCRFRDCRHESEPGCAVQEAVSNGTLDPERILNYRKLQRELAFLERKQNPEAMAELRNLWKRRARAVRRHYKSKN
jgi:ribosome biogenesis GTPase